MAVSQFPNYRKWVGLSTDTKPLHTDYTLKVKNGDEFLEIDTGKNYVYNLTGTAWVEITQSLSVSDLQIGAVELKNATSDDRVVVDSEGYLSVKSVFTSIEHGNLTLDGTAQQLASDISCKSVTVQAGSTNADVVYLGDSTLSGTEGIELSAGSSITLNVNNVNLIYIKGTNTERVNYIVEV